MSLEIVQREQEGIVIIDLKGHLTLGEGVRCYLPWRSFASPEEAWRSLT